MPTAANTTTASASATPPPMPAPLDGTDPITLDAATFTAVVDRAATADLEHWLHLVRLDVHASTQPDRVALARAHDLQPAPTDGSRSRRLSDAAVAAAHADPAVAEAMLWREVQSRAGGWGQPAPRTREKMRAHEAGNHLKWRDTITGRRPLADFLELDITKGAHPDVGRVDQRVDAAVGAWLGCRSPLRGAFAVSLFRALPLHRDAMTDPWFADRRMRDIVTATRRR